MADAIQGAGVEHMTAHYGAGVLPERMSDVILSNPEAADCLLPMGITSENVAKQYNVSRDTQDTFAANSFAKAAEAQRLGKFKDQIVPVKVRQGLTHQQYFLLYLAHANHRTGDVDGSEDRGGEGDHCRCG